MADTKKAKVVKPSPVKAKTADQLRAELDATKKAWRDYVSFYQSTYGLKTQPPAALKKQFENTYIKGGWRPDKADEWIRQYDRNYVNSKPYKAVIADLSALYREAYGVDYKVTGADIKSMDFQARKAPVDAATKEQRRNAYFQSKIMKTPEFQSRNPAFMDWLKQNRGITSLSDGLAKYQTTYSSFLSAWQDAGLSGQVPADLMSRAMAGNWDAEGVPFANAIRSSSQFKSTQSYADKQADFSKQWSAIMPDGVEPDPALAEQYARSGKGWDDFLRDNVSSSSSFTAAYPDYAAWEARQHKLGGEGNAEGQVTIQDYFEARAGYADLWADEFGDQAVDPAIIQQAMEGNWSTTVFRNKIRKLPQFQNTPAAKNKRMEFDTYWRRMFGDGAPVDESLASGYTQSDLTEPSSMWEDIKGSQMFQSQYTNWDAFASAQASAGNNVTEDPMAYKEYQAAFQKAFSDIGMQVPVGMDRQIFASGVSGSDLQNNADVFSRNKESYGWQTGEQADVVTAIGVGDKVAGGDLRKRMAAALEQHKTYANSKFNKFDTDTRTGTKKI